MFDRVGKPSFLNYLPAITPQILKYMDGGYQDRVRGVQPTDEMIDNLVKTLTELELVENTFMFCKSTVTCFGLRSL